ncbi:heterokaryon incompatibility protein-domain-containing protein [Phyllosticta capitalensis]
MKKGVVALQYQPLNFACSLERSEQGLSFNLESGSLMYPPPYVAISYAWREKGDRKKASTILINGIRVPITISLYNALWYASGHKAKDDLIWADQICISQKDVEERSLQVRQMGKIYTTAYTVFVWLGSASHSSDHAMEVCKRVRYERGEEVVLSRVDKEAIAALVAKQNRLILMCGNRTALWSGLIVALNNMPGDPCVSAESQLLMDALEAFRLNEHRGHLTEPHIHLVHALLDSRYSWATVPRDKIFALLDLTRDGSEVVPAPYYTGLDATIFLSVTCYFIAKQAHTVVILLAARTTDRSRLPYSNQLMPSWLPDWGRLCIDLPPWVVSAIKAERENLDLEFRYFGSVLSVQVPSVKLETIAGCADPADEEELRKYHVGSSLTLSELKRFSMKIAWNVHGCPRVVHQNTHCGDWIFRLENCTLPVVLRQRETRRDNTYGYVGEVLGEDATERYWETFERGRDGMDVGAIRSIWID